MAKVYVKTTQSSHRLGYAHLIKLNTMSSLKGTSIGSSTPTTHANAQLVGGMESDSRNRSVTSSLIFSENVVGNLAPLDY